MTLRDQGPLQLWWRDAKVNARRAERLLDHLRRPDVYPPPRYARADSGFDQLHGRRAVAIDRQDPAADARLEAGKRHNLHLAAPCFDGLVLAPDRPLSFWTALGRVTEGRGFRYGMELRGGCLVPALGGGLCLLSNALFALAAELGWTILERHGHSKEAVPPPAHEPWGLDATVFWPHVDLRVAPRAEVRLACRVEAGQLVVEVHGRAPAAVRCEIRACQDQTRVDGGVRQRENVLRRKVFSSKDGSLVGEELLARNHKVLLHQWEQTRTCLTCGESSCRARVVPAELVGG